MNEKEDMKKVMEAMFAVNDISLYLDTHPQCQKAIMLHKKYTKEYQEAKENYECKYGPLSIYSDVDNWNWVYDKWPWEGEVQ